MSGWRVFWMLAALETALFAGALAQFGTDEAGLRALVRFTARVSFLVFAVVYAAAPLRRLIPFAREALAAAQSALSGRRLRLGARPARTRDRAVALLLGDAFEVDAATAVGGGLAYVLTAGRALTSFDRSARWLGPSRWALHRSGLHGLWFVFALNWTVAATTSLIYLPFAALTWAVPALRAALRARRRSAEPIPNPA